MASAISPSGDLIYLIRNKPFNSETITEFLELLLQHLQKTLIIWNNASIHNSKVTRAWLEQSSYANIINFQFPKIRKNCSPSYYGFGEIDCYSIAMAAKSILLFWIFTKNLF